jgi:hypothetical protein
MVARTVNVGTPQVTAKITTLEDLGEIPAGFFDTVIKGVSACYEDNGTNSRD